MADEDVREALKKLLAFHKDAGPFVVEFSISSFSAALTHYRRGTVAAPFPTDIFRLPNGDKDLIAAHTALVNIPPVSQLIADSFISIGGNSLQLLHWIVATYGKRYSSLTQVSTEDIIHDLSQHCHESLPSVSKIGDLPAVIVRLQKACHSGQSGFRRSMIAYHGTCTENLHSIMHSGLLNLSGTRLKRNGAVFGDGIYLSTHYDVALSFCRPGPTWKHSQHGKHMRCLLVCEVDVDKLDGADDGSNSSSSSSQISSLDVSHNNIHSSGQSNPKHGSSIHAGKVKQKGVPDSYIVVSRPDAVRVLYVMMFAEPEQARRNLPWSIIVIVAYVACMLIAFTCSQPSVRKSWKHLAMQLQFTSGSRHSSDPLGLFADDL